MLKACGRVVAATMCCSVAVAAEVVGRVTDAKDWRRLERMEYTRLSLSQPPTTLLRELPRVAPTFVRAANVNTQADRPLEYADIQQRAAYYDLMALVIEHEPLTPKDVQGVRFFHATTIVTLRSMLGAPDQLSGTAFDQGCLKTSPDTRSFIQEVNKQLFAVNMGVLRKLLFVWKRAQHPVSGDPAPVKAFDFDLAMVELEQSTVEDAIAAMRPSQTVRRELNTLMGNCHYQLPVMRLMNPLGESARWADNARQAPFDFFNREHRVLLGKALVTLLHKKSENDFRTAVQLRPRS